MKKIIFLSISLLALVLTGCGTESVQNKKIDVDNCKDCVFAFYNDYENYDRNATTLLEYTRDYKTLKDENGQQRKRFLGHMLDENGKILRGFSCGIENDEVFCLEGTRDGSSYESNREIIKRIYSENECKDRTTDIECRDDVYVWASKIGSVTVMDNNDYTCNTSWLGSMLCS